MDRDRYPRPHFATSDLATTGPFQVMDACREAALVVTGGRGSIVPYGGAGNKLLAAALGEVEATFQHKVGGTCCLLLYYYLLSCSLFCCLLLVLIVLLFYSIQFRFISHHTFDCLIV